MGVLLVAYTWWAQPSQEEIEALLQPERFIGRCPEQVEAFLAKYRNVWEGAEKTQDEISL